MKRCLCFLVIFLFIMSFGFSEANLFSLIELNDFINVEKLISMSDSWYFSDFEKKKKNHLSNVNVKIQRIDNKESHTLFYNSKGLMEKEESRVYEDYDFIYKYDEKDRLLSWGNFTFKYIDDLQRERYCRGELQQKEVLEFQKDKIIITIISYSKRYADGAVIESGKSIYEYIFSEEKLVSVSCRDFTRLGVEKKRFLKLVYDNERIKSIQKFYGEELNCEQVFIYQNGKLVKRSVSYPSDSSANYIAEYSNFDKYGNFQNIVMQYETGVKIYLSREIKYTD